MREYVTSPEYAEINPFGFGKFNNVPNQEGGWSAASFSSFILKVMIAATMFPHLTMRLLVARDSSALQYGLAGMNFTFFIVQLSTMITGWVAVKSFGGAKLEPVLEASDASSPSYSSSDSRPDAMWGDTRARSSSVHGRASGEPRARSSRLYSTLGKTGGKRPA